VGAGPTVAPDRQNLSLLVDHGAPVRGLRRDSLAQMGRHLGNQVLVSRSEVGIAAAGSLVYAGGPGLSVSSLAAVLARAGAVRAVELSINTTWVSYFTFHPSPGAPAAGSNGRRLLTAMARPPSRYFAGGARDFIAALAP